MKASIYFGLIAFCILVCAQWGNLNMPAAAQGRNTQAADDDHVYTAREVDVRAKITNKTENLPKEGADCPREGMVTLRIILHKSGRVTGVTIIKGMGCSYDGATVESARKFKFSPALKDGQQVSQYQIFEYRYGAH